MKIQGTQEETQAQQPHISPADTNNVLQVVQLSMEEILRDAVRRRAAYQVQCVNFGLDTWTLPCQLTESRMKNLLNDSSVRKVRLELEM
jgi:hypothetical protein